MKFTLPASLLSLAIASVQAYPHLAMQLYPRQDSNADPKLGVPAGAYKFPDNMGIPRPAGFPGFNAEEQLVDIHGEHEWQAPRPGDRRGPCAGLNAAANHGYLPRDGIVTRETIFPGLNGAFGLGLDAIAFLTTTTSFFDGDPVSGKWSIGGYSPKTATLGPLQEALLSKQSGIGAYGHLKSEGDASVTRGDFTAPSDNNNCASYPEFFQELLDLAKKRTGGNITPSVLAEHQDNRKSHSIATNPNYFSPAFAGVAFTPAAHHFVFQLMANHSAEHPNGVLTPETLMDFFSYKKGGNDELVYTYGHERIPENHYRRALNDPWSLPDIVAGVVQQCLAYPDNCKVGGNTDGVNTFAGVDVGDLTGGAYNASAYTDPEILGCFISQNIQAEVPTSLSQILQGPALTSALGLVTSKLVPELEKGFGNCNGIKGRKPKTLGDYSGMFPGANVQNSGDRSACRPN